MQGSREHLHKVHSRKNRCERCHTQYPKQVNFDKHLSKNNCDIVKELSYPELMTPEQEEIFGRVFDVMPYENKWRAYYQFLFPNASDHHSVDPCESMSQEFPKVLIRPTG